MDLSFRHKYADEFKSGVSAHFGDFIAKRIARVYPLHVFMTLCFLVFPIGLSLLGKTYDPVAFSMSSFVAKVFLVDLWLVGTETWHTWNVPSWTISGELFAYLLFPVFVYIYQAIAAWAKVLLMTVAMMVLVGLYGRLGCDDIGTCIGELGLLRCAVEFCLGVCVWFLFVETRRFGSSYFKIVTLISCCVLIAAFRSGLPNFYFVPLLFAAMLYGMIGFRSRLHDALEWRVLVYLGEISYSVYLTHMFLRDFLFDLLVRNNEVPGLPFVLLYVSVTLLFSVATYHLIEKRFRHSTYEWIERRFRLSPQGLGVIAPVGGTSAGR